MTASRMVTAALTLVVALGLIGCSDEGSQGPERREVDQQLLAALGMAQAYQHQADELEANGDLEAASARVLMVLDVPFPPGAPEGEDIRLDAWGRIAEISLAQGELDRAEDAIRQGLLEASRVSYFKARLFAVRGRVLQARAAELREAGRDEESRQVSRRAIAELERSIDINRRVLGLADAGPERENEE